MNADDDIQKDELEQGSLASEIAGTAEWLIIAFILVFTFRAFVMEPFRIPTGSMAETLMGAHFRLRCSQCGYGYNYGFIPEMHGFSQENIPLNVRVRKVSSCCPVCNYYQSTSGNMQIAYGDRILVLKCIYPFAEPNRWDVVVFKNPLNPLENYIKRLVGQPGETVEIIDGDVYIDGEISRKPPKVQEELWMPIYNADYQPVSQMKGALKEQILQRPFESENTKWKIRENDPAGFALSCGASEICRLNYNSLRGKGFRSTYAYNSLQEYEQRPYCSDLMIRFYVTASESTGKIGAVLSKYETGYKGWIGLEGQMIIAKVSDGSEKILNQKPIDLSRTNAPVLLEFINVDHQLILRFGEEILDYDLGRKPNDTGTRKVEAEPEVEIFGSGKLTISHIAIFRDIHYTSLRGSEHGRGTEGNAFELKEDEFFVLGDNSPESEDCRWWKQQGSGNNNETYSAGIVPQDYLVGKAVVVYWPSGFRPFVNFPFSIIPNISKIRLIHGGTKR
ncbi:MAG: signal peptidase I [Planctomycetota bacterium]|jgi:signal peptidase I